MRILHVNKFLYRRGGAESYMEDVAGLQRRAGHEVAFFGMDHPANISTQFAAAFPSYLQLHPPPPGLAGKARAVGRMLWSTSAAQGIEAVIDAFDPDVAHLHNIYHHLSPSILGPLARRGVPTVMTLHDYKLACPSYHFLAHGRVCEACLGGHFHRALRRRCKDGSLAASAVLALELAIHTTIGAYSWISLFVCPSRFLAAKMAEAGVFPERMRYGPHFFDPTSVEAADSPGRGVVYAGRLSAGKGVDVLIEALARLRIGHLDIAGEGPARDWLVALAAERAPGRVRFHGWLTKADLHALIRSTTVLAVPSRWYENQPMIVLESFGCGVPVVGTELGGLPELIDPGVDGALVPENDPAALAAALYPFLNDPTSAFDMGKAARTKVEEQFSPERHLHRLEEIYAEAAECVR